MKILVLGASGGIGSAVVGQALARGHSVTAAVRGVSVWRPPEGVELVTAEVSVRDELARAVDAALPDTGAILSCLGLRRAALFPWAPLLSPADLVETVTGHLLTTLASRPRIGRVIWVSAGGVGESIEACSWVIRRMIRAGNVGVAYDDLERAEALVRGARDPRWLTVRPVTLTNGPLTGRARDVPRYSTFSTVSRADVAEWMLDAAEGANASIRGTALIGG